MSNKLNPFEEQLRKAAENHEVPYDASQWDKLERQLNQSGGAQSSSMKWGLSAVAVMVIGLGVYFYQDTTPEAAQQSEVLVESKSVFTEQVVKDEKETIDISNEIEAPKTEEEIQNDEEKGSDDSSSKQKTLASTTVKEVEPIEEKESVTETAEETENSIAVEESTEDQKSTVDVPQVLLAKETICAGVELTGTLDGLESEDIIWHLGNGETFEGSELKYTYLTDGDYEIKAYIPSLNQYAKSAHVTVHPKPDAQFSYIENIERGAIPVVYFSANTGGEKYYSWDLGDGHKVRAEGVAHTFRKQKDYEVSLRVMNKYGCFWTSYQRYTNEKEYNLLAPNSFSPNSDGTNDQWFPKSLTTGYYNFELVVYDRNHKEVFRTSDPNVQFDGRVNGTIAPSGEMFIWKADVVDPSGIRQEFGGTIISIY